MVVLLVIHAGCRGLGRVAVIRVATRKCRRRTCTDDRGWRSCRLQIMKKWKRAGDIGAYAEDVPVLIMSSMTQTNDMMPASHASHGWGSRPMNSRQQQRREHRKAQHSAAQNGTERRGGSGTCRLLEAWLADFNGGSQASELHMGFPWNPDPCGSVITGSV
jgi:hypothetical protein